MKEKRRFVLRIYTFVLSVALLLGSATWTRANVDPNLGVPPKIPKLVEQSPDAPKLVARDDYYSPRYLEVRVKPGNTISLANKGARIHGFFVPVFKFQDIIKPGETKKIPLPKKMAAGQYDFFCPFHPRMTGTVEVLPS